MNASSTKISSFLSIVLTICLVLSACAAISQTEPATEETSETETTFGDLAQPEGEKGDSASVTEEESATHIPDPEPFNNGTTIDQELAHSLNSDEVPFPRLELFMHAIGRLYYIQIPDNVEAMVQEALDMSVPLDGIELDSETTGLKCDPKAVSFPSISYRHGNGDRSIAIIRCNDGRYGLGEIDATVAVSELLSLVEKTMNWKLDVSLRDFTDLTKIEVWIGNARLKETTGRAVLDAFEDFLQHSVYSVPAGEDTDQLVEIRCYTSAGDELSILADPWFPHLWLPPAYNYRYGDYDNESTAALMHALNISEWHKDVLRPDEYPYPDGYFDSMFERLGVLPPEEPKSIMQFDEHFRVDSADDSAAAAAFDADSDLAAIATADLNVLNVNGIIEKEFCPFLVFYGEKELFGDYHIYDAETLEELDFFRPSGLLPQTWIFENAEAGREYIITLLTDHPTNRSTELLIAFRVVWQPA